LARLLAHEACPNGELEAIADPTFRAMAQCLATRSLQERQDVWQQMLVARSDRDQIVQAIADVDPQAPMPQEGSTERQLRKPRQVVLERISEIPDREIEWLCQHRIPRATLTMLVGDTKLGKSLILIQHAACVTRGWQIHEDDRPRKPANVILLAGEDLAAQTIKPRLRAAGADLERVYIIRSSILATGELAWPSLQRDLASIEEEAERVGNVEYVGIDPVTAYIDGIDDNRGTKLRSVLMPLGQMAERLNVAIEMVNHVGKVVVVNAKHRGLGSVAYGGVCRSNWLVAKDPDCPDRTLLLDNGGNLGPPMPTLGYKIEVRDGHPILAWETESIAKTADEVVTAERAAVQNARQENSVRAIAKAWLKDRLRTGPEEVDVLKREAEALNIGWRTIQFAKKDLNVEAKKREGEPHGSWLWSLPMSRAQENP
jgi:hypothetical protein